MEQDLPLFPAQVPDCLSRPTTAYLCNTQISPCIALTPAQEVTGKIPRAQTCNAPKTKSLTRMAQQHHHDSLSQHTSQYSCSNDETQRHDPEPKHNSETASQHATKHHDQQNQWNKQHQLNSSSTIQQMDLTYQKGKGCVTVRQFTEGECCVVNEKPLYRLLFSCFGYSERTVPMVCYAPAGHFLGGLSLSLLVGS